MFADAFWPNFAIFALGQVVAFLYLFTGRVGRGGCLMLAVLLLADVALVARFAYDAETVTVAALALMQAYVFIELVLFAFGRWYRRRPGVLLRRRAEYQAGLVAELQGDDASAATVFKRLCRRDPWDAEVTLALATVERRLGNFGKARRLLRKARSLDRAGKLGDLIYLESGRLSSGAA